MAEEENEQNEEQAPEASAEEAAEAPAPETPEEAPAEKAPAAAPAAVVAEDAPAPLGPKERRRLKRSTHSGDAGSELSESERIERRTAERKRKADQRRRYRTGKGAQRKEAESAAKGPRQGTPPAERVPGMQKAQQGIVVSSKADKTITVRVESARRHPAYEKIIRRSKMLHAHDERNEAGPGDVVRLIETRPMSKTKRWRLTEIVEKAR